MEINLQVFLLVSLIMAALIALLFIVNAIFAKKISAKVRYFMWVVIMFGLIIPLRPSFGDGVIDIPDFTASSIESAEPIMPEVGSTVIDDAPVTPPEVVGQDVVENRSVSLQMVVLFVWATVAIGIVGYHLFQYLRFQQSIRRWGEVEEDAFTLAVFERVKEEMGLNNCKVQLVVCGFISTSMLTGFFKPMILLPERNYDEAELELIFRHELVHYRRKDLWIKLLSVIAMAIHWFNPLVYLMNIALQTEGEASCDQEVLEISQLKNRHFYAEVIIGMIGGKKSGMTTLATNFYGGKKGIKKRLAEVVATTAPQKSISYALLGLIVMLTIMSGSVFAMTSPISQDQNMTDMPEESENDMFEIAITAVGGGEVVEYQLLDEGLVVVHVAYDDEIYHVQIAIPSYQVTGLRIYRSAPGFDDGNEPIETDTPVIDETTTEPTVEPSEPAGEIVPTRLTVTEAIDIATALVISRGHTSATLLEADFGFEYGRLVWEVAFVYRGGAIEVYLDAYDGTIVKFELDID